MRTLHNVHGRITRQSDIRWNLAKTLLQIVVVWPVFLILGPIIASRMDSPLHLTRYRFTSPLWKRVGVALFMLNAAIGLFSAWFMVTRGRGTPLPIDATQALVLEGPYRYTRNPMATTGYAQAGGIALLLGSPTAVVYTLVGAVGWHFLVRPWEEADLAWRFGAPYLHYRDRVRCWIPRLRAYTPPSSTPGRTSSPPQ